MRWIVLIALGTLALGGCHRPRAAILDGQRQPAVANLLLGVVSNPDLASAGIGRSDWPAVVHGYRDDEVTFYTSVLYDQETYFDDDVGLWHDTQTFRMGTWSR